MTPIVHRGSFLGFTYNNIHSSTLGITRVSTSKRYNEPILPTLKDITTDIVGADGVIYFGTKYTKRVFSVSFAFQGMTNEQIKQIKQKFNGKEIHDLIFDEWPYKVYSAKITGQAIAKHLAFQDRRNEYFNGECTLQFTCYFPFARSRYGWQEEYSVDTIPEWRIDEELNLTPTLAEAGNIYYDFDVPQDTIGALVGAPSEFQWVRPTSLLIDPQEYTGDETDNGGIIPFYSDSPYVNYNDWIDASGIPSRENYGKYDEGAHSINFFNAGDVLMPTQWWFEVPLTPTTYTFVCNDETKLVLSL